MITIADLTVATSARPAALFAYWADMATWPEWNLDTEWVRGIATSIGPDTARLLARAS